MPNIDVEKGVKRRNFVTLFVDNYPQPARLSPPAGLSPRSRIQAERPGKWSKRVGQASGPSEWAKQVGQGSGPRQCSSNLISGNKCSEDSAKKFEASRRT